MESNNREFSELVPISIEDEMKKSYLDYAMSVIVSRAIPDARDGLKPVHRRILYAMNETGNDWNKPYRKSARVVGDVMGKYHPHGDAAIYDSLVRMAQDFSLRLRLIDGQGNFGSMDGDSAAAMRYTESRLTRAAHYLIEDIDKDTIDFQENYDGSTVEPVVLPARFPNLLVNGAGGIAVGMATNIPPHNLGEIINACCAFIDDESVSDEALLEFVQGPDFPTGGIIMGTNACRNALLTGRGSIIIRGKTHIEDLKEKRQAIVVTEMPYQVNKAKFVERIADLVREKKIEGISDLRDESDQQGVRVVIELKKDAFSEVILNQLYSYTMLQTSFGVNMLALDNGRPRVMNLRDVVASFVYFREKVIIRRTSFLLNKARDRAHLLAGLAIAVANIDEVIELIRAAKDPIEARSSLLSRSWPIKGVEALINIISDERNIVENGQCFFTEEQAKAILEMRLQRLTGLEQDKILADLNELAVEITKYIEILNERPVLMKLLKEELVEVKEKFATPRKTEISMAELDQDIEDLIPREDMVVTVTLTGYIKRVPLSTYRAQKRGGKGRSGMSVRDEDVTTKLFVSNTHTPVLFFSTLGKVYKLKVYKLPLGSVQSKGRSLMNIFPLAEGETINQVMPLPENEESWDNLNIMFATLKGNIRRNSLSDFRSVQSNGKIAMKLDTDDQLIGVEVCNPEDQIFLAAKGGRSVRFPVDAVRVFKGRTSDGVRGMRLEEGDNLVSMSVLYGAEFSIDIREEYLKIPVELRKEIAKIEDTNQDISSYLENIDINLDHETIKKMACEEQFIITITENGFGKRTSAYEYRVTNRGGSGVVNIITSERNGSVVASNTIKEIDQIMLLTDRGTLIRCPVHDVRITGRNTQGVTLFKVSGSEKVASVAKIEMSAEQMESEENEDIEASSEIVDGLEGNNNE